MTKKKIDLVKELNKRVPKEALGEMSAGWDPKKRENVIVPFVKIAYIYERANEIFGVMNWDTLSEKINDNVIIQKPVYDKKSGQFILKDFIIITAKKEMLIKFDDKEKRISGTGTVSIPKDSYVGAIDGIRSRAIASATKKAFKVLGKTFGLGLADIEDEVVEIENDDLMVNAVIPEVSTQEKTDEDRKLLIKGVFNGIREGLSDDVDKTKNELKNLLTNLGASFDEYKIDEKKRKDIINIFTKIAEMLKNGDNKEAITTYVNAAEVLSMA